MVMSFRSHIYCPWEFLEKNKRLCAGSCTINCTVYRTHSRGEKAHAQLSRAVSLQADRCHAPYVDGARGTERGKLLHYWPVRYPSRRVVPGETPHKASPRSPGISRIAPRLSMPKGS